MAYENNILLTIVLTTPKGPRDFVRYNEEFVTNHVRQNEGPLYMEIYYENDLFFEIK